MFFYLLGLGSNICPDDNIPQALQALSALGRLCAVSPCVCTAPVGATFHGDFKNQLAVLQSDLQPDPLKEQLQQIETRLGREPKNPSRRTKDRTIDIDILGYSDNEPDCRQITLSESYYQNIQQLWDQEINV